MRLLSNPARDHGSHGHDLRVERAATELHVSGEIDAASAPEFRRALQLCDDDPVVQALDLTGVTFFSAAGVRCFVELEWPWRPHVPVIVSAAVRRVLDVCNLEFLLGIHGWRTAEDRPVDEPPAPVGMTCRDDVSAQVSSGFATRSSLQRVDANEASSERV